MTCVSRTMTAARSAAMKQFGLGTNILTKKMREAKFSDEMERVAPRAALGQVAEPHSQCAKTCRPPYTVELMLRIHYPQQRYCLPTLAREQSLHDSPLFREFTKIACEVTQLSDEPAILRFMHLLERHCSAADSLRLVRDILDAKCLLWCTATVVDAALIAVTSSIDSAGGPRTPEMKQTEKRKHWYLCMKSHIGADGQSGLGHVVAVVGRCKVSGQVQDVQPAPDVNLRGRARGEVDGQHPRQGRAPVARHQTPVRIQQGVPPRVGQEQGATGDAVRAEQPVAGGAREGAYWAKKSACRVTSASNWRWRRPQSATGGAVSTPQLRCMLTQFI